MKTLVELGVTEGDVVSVCSPNSIEMACIVYATLYLGLAISPLNFMYSRNELKHMITLTKPAVIFCSSLVESVIADVVATQIDFSTLVVVIGKTKRQAQLTTSQLLYKSSYRDIKDIPIRKVNTEENVAGIFSSSGTTGLPKGVSITQSTFHFNFTVGGYVIYC